MATMRLLYTTMQGSEPCSSCQQTGRNVLTFSEVKKSLKNATFRKHSSINIVLSFLEQVKNELHTYSSLSFLISAWSEAHCKQNVSLHRLQTRSLKCKPLFKYAILIINFYTVYNRISTLFLFDPQCDYFLKNFYPSLWYSLQKHMVSTCEQHMRCWRNLLTLWP